MGGGSAAMVVSGRQPVSSASPTQHSPSRTPLTRRIRPGVTPGCAVSPLLTCLLLLGPPRLSLPRLSYLGFPTLGIQWKRTESAALRRYAGLTEAQTGEGRGRGCIVAAGGSVYGGQ